MSKRLFFIRNAKGVMVRTSHTLDGYFQSKQDAKRVRDELNQGRSEPKFFVSRGPDHRKHNQM